MELIFPHGQVNRTPHSAFTSVPTTILPPLSPSPPVPPFLLNTTLTLDPPSVQPLYCVEQTHLLSLSDQHDDSRHFEAQISYYSGLKIYLFSGLALHSIPLDTRQPGCVEFEYFLHSATLHMHDTNLDLTCLSMFSDIQKAKSGLCGL